MEVFGLLKVNIKKYMFYFITFIFTNLIIWCISIINPFITGKYIDLLSGEALKNVKSIYSYIIVLCFIWVLEILFSYCLNIITTKLQSKICLDLNFNMIKHIEHLPMSYLNNIDAAYLNQRINMDINIIVPFFTKVFIEIILKIATFIASAYVLLKLNMNIGFLLSGIISINSAIYLCFRKPLYNIGMIYKEKQNNVFSNINRQLDNISFVKINGLYDYLSTQIKKVYDDFFKTIMRFYKLIFLFSGSDMITSRLGYFTLFFYGGIEVIQGRLSIGQFIVVNTYFSMLLGCTSYFLSLGKSYQDALASYNRIKEILDMRCESNGNIILNDVQSIELKNINFTFDKERYIFRNFNYSFKKGKIYCIIGQNGIGKSTLINLIVGIYGDCYEGDILYNSINIKELDLNKLRETLIGVSGQEPILLGNSIKSNILYGLDDVSYDKFDNWCNDSNIKEFTESLFINSKKLIEEELNSVSGGEKQKISHSRIFIKDPEVIIMDEPTSALDKESINSLKLILTKLKTNKIIILITHNSCIEEISDEIINLNMTVHNNRNI